VHGSSLDEGRLDESGATEFRRPVLQGYPRDDVYLDEYVVSDKTKFAVYFW
jgi:hypothetical protein